MNKHSEHLMHHLSELASEIAETVNAESCLLIIGNESGVAVLMGGRKELKPPQVSGILKKASSHLAKMAEEVDQGTMIPHAQDVYETNAEGKTTTTNEPEKDDDEKSTR